MSTQSVKHRRGPSSFAHSYVLLECAAADGRENRWFSEEVAIRDADKPSTASQSEFFPNDTDQEDPYVLSFALIDPSLFSFHASSTLLPSATDLLRPRVNSSDTACHVFRTSLPRIETKNPDTHPVHSPHSTFILWVISDYPSTFPHEVCFCA